MPYEKESGKWRHPGGTCSDCKDTGAIITKEKVEGYEGEALYTWRCECNIGNDRALIYPLYQDKRHYFR